LLLVENQHDLNRTHCLTMRHKIFAVSISN
jgi:hypothetical protein